MPIDHRPIQRFYGRWARLYDLLATAPFVHSWRVDVADELDLKAGDVVVEMGCGTGANLPVLRDRVGASGRVVGVDLTAGVLGRASERITAAGWSNVDVLAGDARDPPIGGEIDAIVGTFVVGMFEEPAAVVDRWCDLLGQGGRIALLDAGLSDRPIGIPLNAGFRAFTRLSAPASRTSAQSPAVVLSGRIRAAHDQLAARTDGTRRSRRTLGFLQHSSGTVR